MISCVKGFKSKHIDEIMNEINNHVNSNVGIKLLSHKFIESTHTHYVIVTFESEWSRKKLYDHLCIEPTDFMATVTTFPPATAPPSNESADKTSETETECNNEACTQKNDLRESAIITIFMVASAIIFGHYLNIALHS
jgi:hypothetical protein